MIWKCLLEDCERENRQPTATEAAAIARHLSGGFGFLAAVAQLGGKSGTRGATRANTGISKPRADRVMRLPEVVHATGLSPVTLWRHERDGKFPRRRKLNGGRAMGWRESEIRGWLAGS